MLLGGTIILVESIAFNSNPLICSYINTNMLVRYKRHRRWKRMNFKVIIKFIVANVPLTFKSKLYTLNTYTMPVSKICIIIAKFIIIYIKTGKNR